MKSVFFIFLAIVIIFIALILFFNKLVKILISDEEEYDI